MFFRKGWTYVVYPEKSKIVRHALHPGMAMNRLCEIADKYGYRPEHTAVKESVWADPGGMSMMNPPTIKIALGYGRTLEVAEHNLEWLRETVAVKQSDRIKMIGGKKWVRFNSWPGTLIYLSMDDARRILKVVPKEGAAGEHEAKMAAALIEANAAIQAVKVVEDAKEVV